MLIFFFFMVTPTTKIYTLSLHDALPISVHIGSARRRGSSCNRRLVAPALQGVDYMTIRSEEHTSELQSRGHLVCRLLLGKKKPCVVPITTSDGTASIPTGRTRRYILMGQ